MMCLMKNVCMCLAYCWLKFVGGLVLLTGKIINHLLKNRINVFSQPAKRYETMYNPSMSRNFDCTMPKSFFNFRGNL